MSPLDLIRLAGIRLVAMWATFFLACAVLLGSLFAFAMALILSAILTGICHDHQRHAGEGL